METMEPHQIKKNFERLCSNESPEVVEQALGKIGSVGTGKYAQGLLAACQNGRFDTVRLLCDKASDLPSLQSWQNNLIFNRTCETGILRIAQLLYDLGFQPDAATLSRVCAARHAEEPEQMVRWLCGIRDPDDRVFILACQNGYGVIARYLYNIAIFNNAPLSNTTLTRAFVVACQNGFGETAKWLRGIGADPSARELDECFISVCRIGNHRMMEWLREQIGTIRVPTGWIAFNMACEMGELDMAKRLYQIDPNFIMSDANRYRDPAVRAWFDTLKLDS